MPISAGRVGDRGNVHCTAARPSAKQHPMASLRAMPGSITVRTMADLLRYTGEERRL